MRSLLKTGYWCTVIDPVTLRLTPDAPGQFWRGRIRNLGNGHSGDEIGDVIGQLEALLVSLKANS